MLLSQQPRLPEQQSEASEMVIQEPHCQDGILAFPFPGCVARALLLYLSVLWFSFSIRQMESYFITHGFVVKINQCL